MVFSRATFGPGCRTNGVLDHILKEVEEVRESSGSPEEWVDIVILALDGLTRSVWNEKVQLTSDAASKVSCGLILDKQGKNELRDWPDWRTSDPEKAIEHVRN